MDVTPRVSVAMIVRNEAAQLPGCLASLDGLGPELCIVDTGSSDNTPAIARAHGARVAAFPWCDDFAAARNAALALCTAPWVFVIDADERVAREDVETLSGLLEGAVDRCYRFTTRNYTRNTAMAEFQPCQADDPLAQGFPGWYPSVKVRLFPNRPGVQFEGRVHELVTQSLMRLGVPIAPAPVPIHHYGAARPPDQLAEKAQFYLRLGAQKAEESPEDANAWAELGNQCAELGQYAPAAAAYREALKRRPDDAVVLKDLGGVLHLIGRSAEAEAFLRLAIAADPGCAEAWRNLGVVEADAGRWDEAVACFERLVALHPAHAGYQAYLAEAQRGQAGERPAGP